MKQRFSYLDLQLVTNELAVALAGARLQNVYTLESSARQFLFKFENSGKQQLFVDPGQRAHLTGFQHLPASTPPHFVQSIRKWLQNRCVSKVFCVEGTRTLVISLSDNTLHLVIELFSGGNIMVVQDSKICALLRTVKPSYVVGGEYAFKTDISVPTEINVVNVQLARALAPHASAASASLLHCCLLDHHLDPKQKFNAQEAETNMPAIKASLTEAVNWADRIVKAEMPYTGYILRDKDGALEFEPFKEYFDLEIEKNPTLSVAKCASYNETVDTFFKSVWTERQGSKLDAIHAQAEQRRKKARDEHQSRVDALHAEEERYAQLGELIVAHSDAVSKAILAVNSLNEQRIDWGNAERLIALEKEKGNDVAEIIVKLDMKNNRICLDLAGTEVFVDLSLSALANAKEYFDLKRQTQQKAEKAEKHVVGALKSAEARISKDLERSVRQQEQQAAASALRKVRQPYWFEKFYWFITSQGRLVVAGRDDAQNALLIRRYFDAGDTCVFQMDANSSVALIKGEHGPQTLIQAANFVCLSSQRNWESKSRADCYFMPREQVPKLVKSEPVSVSGLKGLVGRQPVPPTSLEVGVALMWQVEADGEAADVESESESELEEFPDIEFDSDGDGDSDLDKQVDAEPEQLNKVEPEPVDEQVEVEPVDVEKVEVEPVDVSSSSSEKINGMQRSTDSMESSTKGVKKLKVRGQKKKLKKYLNQDEEDRQAAMERLGTLKGLERQKQAEEARKLQQQKERQQEAERAARRKLKDLTFMDKPEPQPLPTDLCFDAAGKRAVAAVPMFAPWSSMQAAKIKAKLVQGQLKKGKATAEVLAEFRKELGNDAEKIKLVDAVRPVDVQNAIAVTKLQLANKSRPQARKPKGKKR